MIFATDSRNMPDMAMAGAPTIFSIGHSNHDYETFLALLRGAEVHAIADIRSVPYSRRVPHFNAQRLQGQLERDGIEYCYLGEKLGGRPADPELFRDGRALQQRSVPVEHILVTGEILSQQCIEQRLLDALDAGEPDLFTTPAERLAAAYRLRASKVAFSSPRTRR